VDPNDRDRRMMDQMTERGMWVHSMEREVYVGPHD
jgi:hypothetical protein